MFLLLFFSIPNLHKCFISNTIYSMCNICSHDYLRLNQLSRLLFRWSVHYEACVLNFFFCSCRIFWTHTTLLRSIPHAPWKRSYHSWLNGKTHLLITQLSSQQQTGVPVIFIFISSKKKIITNYVVCIRILN